MRFNELPLFFCVSDLGAEGGPLKGPEADKGEENGAHGEEISSQFEAFKQGGKKL